MRYFETGSETVNRQHYAKTKVSIQRTVQGVYHSMWAFFWTCRLDHSRLQPGTEPERCNKWVTVFSCRAVYRSIFHGMCLTDCEMQLISEWYDRLITCWWHMTCWWGPRSDSGHSVPDLLQAALHISSTAAEAGQKSQRHLFSGWSVEGR